MAIINVKIFAFDFKSLMADEIENSYLLSIRNS